VGDSRIEKIYALINMESNMGILSAIKKEWYINHLTGAFKIVYRCGDFAAIECMRKHYSFDELKSIYAELLEAEDRGSLDMHLRVSSPFKDSPDIVETIDAKHRGH